MLQMQEEIPDERQILFKCGSKQNLSKVVILEETAKAIKAWWHWTAIWTVEVYPDTKEKKSIKRRWKGGFKTKTAALAYAANPIQEEKESPTLRTYYTGWEKSDMCELVQI